jgi:hypothetical protein
MDIQFSPINNINLVQRNIKNPKNIKIKLTRYLNYNIKEDITLKIKRTLKKSHK